jgi:short-subunit dehydrogenase
MATLGTALVTGASSGIGEIYADRLARRGYDLVLVGRNAAKLGELAGSLNAETGRHIERIVADLKTPGDLARVETRLRADPAITLLVNSAGLASGGALSDGDLDGLSDMLAVNVTALTRLTATAAKEFVHRGQGGIINLASAMALIDTPVGAAYAASKAYVLNLTLSLDLDLKPRGVRVQAVLPGYTATAMIADRSDIPAQYIMDAGEMVDAALAGFDAGELVTIPSLPDPADFERYLQSRVALRGGMSRDHAAPRYTAKTPELA